MTTSDITDTIVSAAHGPASAGNKTENASAHDPRALIEVDRYLRERAALDAAAAANNPFGTIAFAQVYPPGACTPLGDCH